MQLNTSTELRTAISGAYRVVTLQRGEAFFLVTGYSLHVIVGGWSISAGNTSFSVRDYSGSKVDIMALNGLLRIDAAPDGPPSLPSVRRVFRVLSAGQIATLRAGKVSVSVQSLERANVERKLMWRYGMLEFVNETLGKIAAKFKRYGHTRLVVDDDSTRNLRVGGRFSAFDTDTFIATVSRVFGLRIETSRTDSGAVVHLGRMSRAETASASATR